MSKLRGIRIKDISDNYLTINRVIVDVDGKPTVKESGKAKGRLRKHRIPSYIGALISEASVRKSPDDYLISMCGHAIYMRWKRLLEKNDLNHMRFHDLRHPYVKATTKIIYYKKTLDVHLSKVLLLIHLINIKCTSLIFRLTIS